MAYNHQLLNHKNLFLHLSTVKTKSEINKTKQIKEKQDAK
jgi:hypothetical protein